jgi:hypothetical protein
MDEERLKLWDGMGHILGVDLRHGKLPIRIPSPGAARAGVSLCGGHGSRGLLGQGRGVRIDGGDQRVHQHDRPRSDLLGTDASRLDEFEEFSSADACALARFQDCYRESLAEWNASHK